MRGNLDFNRAKGLMIDGPCAQSSTNVASLAAQYNLNVNSPYMIVLNPGVTTQNVQMYTPPNNQVMLTHEVWNSATATGVLTLKNIAGTTIGSCAAGKRAEVVYNPNAVPPDWSAFLSA